MFAMTWQRRLIDLIAACVFIIVAFYITINAVAGWQEMNETRIAPQWVKDAHRYHGLETSYEERGADYFIRKGKVIRLDGKPKIIP